MEIVRSEKELYNIVRQNEVMIYGIGQVSMALLGYLYNNEIPLSQIKCFVVTELGANSPFVMGIPVLEFENIEITDTDIFIIATLERTHNVIANHIKQSAGNTIYAISNECYREMRQNNFDFSADIIQEIVRTRNVLLRETDFIKSKIHYLYSIPVLQNKISKIEQCIKNGVNFYEESLNANEYEKELKKWFFTATGKELDLVNPKTFNEKIQWLKLNYVNKHITKLADKYLVREWVKEKVGEEYLVPVIGVWDKFDEININQLPDQFVLKCNHGCGWNEIVLDKKNWNIRLAKKKFNRWINYNFAFNGGLELQYRDIEPKIICEKYISNQENDLFDYKFWCFNGKVKFVMFLSGRNESLKMDNFDCEWNHLPFTYSYPNAEHEIEKPDNLNEMIYIAEILSQNLPFVRVDLYRLNDGSIKFGEMTFTPASGACQWTDDNIDFELGRLIDII